MRRLLVLLVALATVAVLVFAGGDDRRPVDRSGAVGNAQVDPAVRRAAADASVDTTDARRVVETPLPSAPVVAARRDDALVGRVTDPQGGAIDGARVTVTRLASDGFALLDRGAVHDPVPVAEVATDTSGSFVVPLPRGVPHRVFVSAGGWCSLHSGPHVAGEIVEITLGLAARLIGRVQLGAEPVAGAAVVVRAKLRDESRRGAVVSRALTDVLGEYRIDGLAELVATVAIEAPRGSIPRAQDVELHAGVETRLDVTLVPAEVVRGLVVDAATGIGIGGAEVGLSWRIERPVRTAVDGTFVYPEFPLGYAELSARADGYAIGDGRVREAGVTIGGPVILRLTASRRAQGRIVRIDGSPVAGAYVAATGYEFAPSGGHRIDWRAVQSDTNGDFLIDELRSDIEHVLLVHADGFGVRQVDFPTDSRSLPVVHIPDVVLEPGLAIVGSVVDEVGVPWARASITMHGSADGRRPAGVPAPTGYRVIEGYVAERTATADDLGRFAFVDVAPGSYALSVLRDLGRPDTPKQLRVASGITPAPVELLLFRGASIRGRITVADDGRIPKCYVSVDPSGGGNTPTDVECAPDGSFVATGLGRGMYTLSFYPYPTQDERAAGRVFAATKVEDVPAGREDLTVRLALQR